MPQAKAERWTCHRSMALFIPTRFRNLFEDSSARPHTDWCFSKAPKALAMSGCFYLKQPHEKTASVSRKTHTPERSTYRPGKMGGHSKASKDSHAIPLASDLTGLGIAAQFWDHFKHSQSMVMSRGVPFRPAYCGWLRNPFRTTWNPCLKP